MIAGRRDEGGFSLPEAVLVLAIFGILLVVATPSLFASLSRSRVRAAARELAAGMSRLRSEAIAGHQRVAMRFTRLPGRTSWCIYRDDDGDGVRSDDIAAGRDPLIAGPIDLPSRYEGVDFGLLPTAIPEVPPGTGTLGPAADPVRFGRSDIVTFTPWGTSSSGSLYVSDGRSSLMAIVLYGATGRIRTCRYDRDRGGWDC